MSDDIKPRYDANETKLEVIVKILVAFDIHLLLNGKQIKSWTTIQGIMVTGTLLPTMEFR